MAARPAAAITPKPASNFAALPVTWIGPVVVALGPTGVLVAGTVVPGATGVVVIGIVTVPGVDTTWLSVPMTIVVGDGQ